MLEESTKVHEREAAVTLRCRERETESVSHSGHRAIAFPVLACIYLIMKTANQTPSLNRPSNSSIIGIPPDLAAPIDQCGN